MLFKLSVKNIRKSLKDYAIYFMTLILGVAIFYIFNSLDSQQAMTDLTSSTKEIIKLMITMLSGISVFVSCILAFLIVYANNFLIKRRKKEFGVYMTLGMGKGQISESLWEKFSHRSAVSGCGTFYRRAGRAVYVCAGGKNV